MQETIERLAIEAYGKASAVSFTDASHDSWIQGGCAVYVWDVKGSLVLSATASTKTASMKLAKKALERALFKKEHGF